MKTLFASRLMACLVHTLVATFALVPFAHAQAWPDRPINIIVGNGPGGLSDALTRLVADQLQGRLGQPVVVEFKPGANGSIATAQVARAKPDGYTLMMVSSAYTTAPYIQKDPGYDPETSLTPISMLARGTIVLSTAANSGIDSMGTLIAQAKVDPEKFAYASPGIGGIPHFAGEMLKEAAGLSLLHVPYKGGAAALNDLLGGEIPLQIGTVSFMNQHYISGRVRALAVASEKRDPALPDVPTFQELGYPLVIQEWWALMAPAATPQAVIERLNKEVVEILALPNIFDQLIIDAQGQSPEATKAFMTSERLRWSKFIQQHTITAQ